MPFLVATMSYYTKKVMNNWDSLHAFHKKDESKFISASAGALVVSWGSSLINIRQEALESHEGEDEDEGPPRN